MNKYAVLVMLRAKPGKEMEVAEFLHSAVALVAAETGTTTWFAFKISADTFGMFDTFKDGDARQAHLRGCLMQALLGKADDLLALAPLVQPVELLAEKA